MSLCPQVSAGSLHAFESPNIAPLATVGISIQVSIHPSICSLHLSSSICIYLSSYIYYLYPCPGGHEGCVAARHHLRPHRAVQAVQGRGAAAALPLHQVSVTCHTCLLLSRVTIVTCHACFRTETIRHFLAPPIRGVVLQCYGAGNMPSNRQEL